MTALLTFEAVARYKSITLAAGELERAQGAVSRQVTLLEERLGIRLFFRERNRNIPIAGHRSNTVVSTSDAGAAA